MVKRMSPSESILTAEAKTAIRVKSSLQSSIRGFINLDKENSVDPKKTADCIARVCSAVREELQDWIFEEGEEESANRRKTVNNQLNDVSRICRNELYYSIKCKKRSGGYVYEAEEWSPPVKTSYKVVRGEDEIASAESLLVSSSIGTHIPTWNVDALGADVYKEDPRKVIETLRKHHSMEDITRWVLDMVREEEKEERVDELPNP
jgi:hypothetical protein